MMDRQFRRAHGAPPSWLRRALPVAALAGFTLFPAVGSAQPVHSAVNGWVPEAARGHAFELSLNNFMQGPSHTGVAPSGLNWTDDSRWLYFRWLPAGEAWDATARLYRIPATGGTPEPVSPEFAASDSMTLALGGGAISPDNRWRITVLRGDLYIVDRRTMAIRRLTDTREAKSAPRYSADGRRVFYVQGGQIFQLELASGAIRQLTDIRGAAAGGGGGGGGGAGGGAAGGAGAGAGGLAGFLRDQQTELFAHIRRQQARQEEQRAANAASNPTRFEEATKTVFTGRFGNPGSLQIDPNGRYVMLQASPGGGGGGNTRSAGVPLWITADGYTAFNNTRTKVGDGEITPTNGRYGIHEIGGDSIVWLDIAGAIQRWAGERAPVGVPVAGQAEAVAAGTVGVRGINFRGWNDLGTVALFSASSTDNKHRWVLTARANTGELSLLEHLADSAWVGGPCGGCSGWVPNSERAYWVSEADRFAHLYAANADGSDLRQLTSGDFEVHQVTIPEQREDFLLRTSEGSPFEQHMWRMRFDGSNRTRITSGVGYFGGTLSPDGRRMAIVHSTQTRPDELFMADARAGAAMAQITNSPTEAFLAFPWVRAEIVRVPAQDGAMVPARIYRPSDMGVEPNGAAVLFVHGAGYLQNVHEWWSSYAREYMFHHYLIAQGFTVLDMDYRASAGLGRDWRTGIYRWMGGKDLSDHVDGVDWLVRNEGVDRGRIGLYGGSYGGFITLMALFTEPDVFHAGGALRSVTDWAHYNEGYTSNILNRPQDDPEAYKKSSPIYFAEGLKGHLLMGHPMYDTNVHFSDIVRLTQRLLELGKENWELSVYPTENHGMVDPVNWIDQYRRIYELFWKTLSAPGCTAGTGVCELPVYRGN